MYWFWIRRITTSNLSKYENSGIYEFGRLSDVYAKK